MNDVPYAFCDAVATILHDLQSIRECMNEATSLNWGIWKAASEDHFSQRLKIRFLFTFSGGNWSYLINKLDSFGKITFIQLQDVQVMKRNYVHVDCLIFDSNQRHSKPATFDEIVQILAFLCPFTNHAGLLLGHLNVKNSELSKLILILYEGSFRRIVVYQWRGSYRAFLCQQMNNSKCLRSIEHDEKIPKDILAQIIKFHRTK